MRRCNAAEACGSDGILLFMGSCGPANVLSCNVPSCDPLWGAVPRLCAAGCAVAAALIMSEARRQRMAAFGRSGDLTPQEARVLTAAMLLKQRGSRAVQWHPLWRDAFLRASASTASLTTLDQQIRTPCTAV